MQRRRTILVAGLLCTSFFTLSLHSAAAQPMTVDREELRKMIREVVKEELRMPVSAPIAPGGTENPPEASTGMQAIVQEEVSKQLAEQPEPNSIQAGAFSLKFEGYGDIQYAHHDYTENGFPSEGSRGASRADFDATRFTLELEAAHEKSGLSFEAEMEFEHGGTGATKELDYDEFGEFETEVEKGGEVVLEELYLRKQFSDGWSARAGKFYLAMGLLSDYHLPTDYLGTSRPETETTILPGVWEEIGFEAKKQFEKGAVTLQLVNGLDSTGFGASQWIAKGKQDNFEVNRAQNLAIVARADTTVVPGLLLGASGYYGGSSDNRPKADLGDDIDGTVFIADAHARYNANEVRAQGAIIYGHLDDAAEISERNSRLSNELGVERTAVADGAFGLWTEVGYNLAQFAGLQSEYRLEPFFRFDYYDTHFDTRADLPDNDRYERSVYTAGMAFTYDNFVVTKLDYSIREFGQSDLSSQNTLRLGLGFVY